MRRISPQDSRLTPVRYAASQGTGKDPTQLRLNGAPELGSLPYNFILYER
jgi:hypothetical protein